jgi:hypothetical protein
LQTLNPNLTNPSGLSGLVSGDFNGDGRLDLVTASSSTAQLSLFAGLGNGSFGNAIVTNLPAGITPTFLVAGKFTSHNITDVAVATATGTVQIFFGSPSGVFQAGPVIATGGAISALAAGDLDNTGLADLVVGNGAANTITEYLNRGGSFAAFPSITVAATPTVIVLGDYHLNGFDDAVVGSSTSGTLNILQNNGSGQLTPSSLLSLPAGAVATDLATVLPQDDGQLVVASNPTGSVEYYTADMSEGVFGFFIVRTVNGITDPRHLAVGDFAGNSLFDVAVSNGNGNTVTVIPGPSGTPVTAFTAGPACTFLVSGDFNDDGSPDLAVANSNGAMPTVTVAQNQSVANTSYFATGSGPGVQAQVNIYNSQGQFMYSFNPFPGVVFTGGIRVAVGPAFNSGFGPSVPPDLVVGTGPGGITVVKIYGGQSVLKGNPGEAAEFNPFGAAFGGGVFVALGDLNGLKSLDTPDGALDEVVCGADAGAGPEVTVWRVLGGGIRPGAPFSASMVSAFFAYPMSFRGGVRVACADVNADGLDDIITGAGPGGGPLVEIYLGDKNTFVNPNMFASFLGILAPPGITFSGGVFVTAGDFDGDGKAEVIVSADQGGGPQVQVFTGASINANPMGTAPIGGFNALIASGFLGGTRVGTTLGFFQGRLSRVLASTAGPGGNQLTLFDVFSFLGNPGAQPPQFLGAFIPPVIANGAYVS